MQAVVSFRIGSHCYKNERLVAVGWSSLVYWRKSINEMEITPKILNNVNHGTTTRELLFFCQRNQIGAVAATTTTTTSQRKAQKASGKASFLHTKQWKYKKIPRKTAPIQSSYSNQFSTHHVTKYQKIQFSISKPSLSFAILLHFLTPLEVLPLSHKCKRTKHIVALQIYPTFPSALWHLFHALTNSSQPKSLLIIL